MSLGFSVEEQNRWMESNRPRVEARTGAPVLAYSTFYRAGSWGQMGMEQVSPLAKSAMKLIGKRKAGGLPPHFILALTADRLYALAYKPRRDVIEVGDEVASWDRAAISARVAETTLTMRLTISSRADGSKTVCDTGKAEITDHFLAQLGALREAEAA
jgi:hypothetical protein